MRSYSKANQQIVLFILLNLMLAIFLTSCSSAKLSALDNQSVVVAFGDSLTEGYGVKAEQSYPAVLQELTGLTVINAGVSGETTSGGLERLPKVLEQYTPDLVILFEGGNDILRKRPLHETETNLKQMIAMIQQTGAEVLLVGVPEKKLFGSSLPLYSELADEFNVPLEEDIAANLMKRPSMKSDFVHFNEKGYRELALAIYDIMQSYGAIE